MNNEIWKDVKGYEGYYQVSNFGRVKSLDRVVVHRPGSKKRQSGKIIKPKLIWSGYLQVCLCKNNIKKYHSVHRLVLISFKPCVFMDNLQANHINGIRSDNYLNNLEWCTCSENNIHSYRVLKRTPSKSMLGIIGDKNPHSIPVVQKDLNNKIIKVFDSSASVERELGFNQDFISSASRGVRKTAYGYKWERLNNE